jgi:hypothetical protein
MADMTTQSAVKMNHSIYSNDKSSMGSIDKSSSQFKRTLHDRATILEELEQQKMQEMRAQLSTNKAFIRKNNKYISTNSVQQMLNHSLN